MLRSALIVRTLLSLLLCSIAKIATASNDTYPNAVHRDYFYIGGEYVFDASANGSVFTGQMYVEHLTPSNGIQQPYPLVFIHGRGMTGTNWLNTPDGRPGWASYFLQQGYEIYIVDQPARGRSPWLPTSGLAVKTNSAEFMEERFTATRFSTLWPQANLHTQWPGDNNETSGRMGDPAFDAFYASTVQFVSNESAAQTMMQKAGAPLLDRIGPAILLTHSQAGPFGWLIADVRPHLVKAIVSVEPGGPPFREAVFSNTPARRWGVADIPMIYKPPVHSSSNLSIKEVPSADANRASCILQNEPARTLVNLIDIPILVETAEASYHAFYDHCTVDFLRQAGVKVDFIRLEDREVYGNGHMQMMEKNNLEVASVLHQWIGEVVGESSTTVNEEETST